jgi:hypothetical protein
MQRQPRAYVAGSRLKHGGRESTGRGVSPAPRRIVHFKEAVAYANTIRRTPLEFPKNHIYDPFHKISQSVYDGYVHCKKMLAVFPSPAGMSLTRESLVS